MSPQEKKQEKNIIFQKDLISLSLKQRLKNLVHQKELGDKEFETSKIQLKDFYRQIRTKIDEQE